MADKTTKATVLAPPAPSTVWASGGEFYAPGEQELPTAHYEDLKARAAIEGTPEAQAAQAEQEAAAQLLAQEAEAQQRAAEQALEPTAGKPSK